MKRILLLAIFLSLLTTLLVGFSSAASSGNHLDKDFVQLFSSNAHGKYSWIDSEVPGLTGIIVTGKFTGNELEANADYLVLLNRSIILGQVTADDSGLAKAEFPTLAFHLHQTNAEIICVPGRNFSGGTLIPSESDTYLLPVGLVNFP